MTSTELKTFSPRLQKNDLTPSFSADYPIVPAGSTISRDLSPIHEAVEELIGDAEITSHRIDAHLVEVVYESLNDLPHSLSKDMGFWSWLCIKQFPDLVWARWNNGNIPEDPVSFLDSSNSFDSWYRRFSGNPTLRGFAHNTLSRIYWCGQILEENGDIDLAVKALTMQDIQSQVFETIICLSPEAARACVKAFSNMTSVDIQENHKRVRNYFSTRLQQGMAESDIIEMINSW